MRIIVRDNKKFTSVAASIISGLASCISLCIWQSLWVWVVGNQLVRSGVLVCLLNCFSDICWWRHHACSAKQFSVLYSCNKDTIFFLVAIWWLLAISVDCRKICAMLTQPAGCKIVAKLLHWTEDWLSHESLLVHWGNCGRCSDISDTESWFNPYMLWQVCIL